MHHHFQRLFGFHAFAIVRLGIYLLVIVKPFVAHTKIKHLDENIDIMCAMRIMICLHIADNIYVSFLVLLRYFVFRRCFVFFFHFIIFGISTLMRQQTVFV